MNSHVPMYIGINPWNKNRGSAVLAKFLPTGCKNYDKTNQKRISEIQKINRRNKHVRLFTHNLF
jgi:hypothetical protein